MAARDKLAADDRPPKPPRLRRALLAVLAAALLVAANLAIFGLMSRSEYARSLKSAAAAGATALDRAAQGLRANAPASAPAPFRCNASKLDYEALREAILSKSVVSTATVPDALVHIHPVTADEHVSGSLMRDGMWEGHLWVHLQKDLMEHPDALFLDIGANLGVYSLIAAKMGHDVIAFDPLKRNVEKMCASIADNDASSQVQLFYGALSSEPGEFVDFRHSPRNVGGTGVVRRNDSSVEGEYGVDYSRTIVLDDLTELVRGKKLIIKMDIEGSECAAIEGGLRALGSASEIVVLMTEWFQVAKSCKDGQEYVDNLSGLGLKPYSITGIPKEGQWDLWNDIDLMFRSKPRV